MRGEARRLNCPAVEVAETVPRQPFSAATRFVESFEAPPCYEVV